MTRSRTRTRASRPLATAGLGAVVAGLLAGCVENIPSGAVDWLGEREGVAEASILTDGTGPWSSSGLVRGELDPDLHDAAIARLVTEVQGYAAETGSVGFWLGIDGLDFVVPGDGTAPIALWREMRAVDGLASGVVDAADVRARTLRPDAVAAFDALAALDAGIRLEAFAGQPALAADELTDLQDDQPNPTALEFRRPPGCEPEPAVRDFAASLVDREDIPGATLDLCTGMTLDLPPQASVATAAVELRDELEGRGLAEFPVQLLSEGDVARFASITPGDASLLPVLQVFEQPGAPPVSYSLAPDGNLAVTAYDIPTRDLLTLVSASPVASRLATIGLEGSPVAVLATLERLPAILDEALVLDAASDHFGSVQLGAGFGGVALQTPDGGPGTPDVEQAAADLRASGATENRFFSVRYAAFQADIVNGVAALSDPDYVGADVIGAFVDAWNAHAG